MTMPYIDQDDRDELRPGAERPAETAGELNFQFTELALAYIAHNGKDYQAINDIIGALEGAKLEFYRRLAAPYEDFKATVNGDVFDA